jgi:ankyrin repeat protein
MEEDGSPTTRYLEMACQAGHSGVVEVLLRYGALSADPKVLTSSAQPSYQTPVALAATEGHSQCLKWLIVYGALTELSHVRPNLR